MIYTKTNSRHGSFDPKFFKPLIQAKFEKDSIYWYDQHSASVHGVPFNKFIKQAHWDHLKTDPTAKILTFYGDEYFNIIDVTDWCDTLKKHGINPSQFYVIVLDENWISWLTREMAKQGIVGVNIQALNLLMDRVPCQESPNKFTHRFSILSRNYNKHRLAIYAELFNRKVLKQSIYTFNNILPYGKIVTIPHEQIISDLESVGCRMTPSLQEWVKKIPYTFKTSSVLNKLADDTYNIIKKSAINLVIESHFDPHWTTMGSRGQWPVDVFSPAFPTEKTYKAIGCGKPFVMFTTPYFLKELKVLGYKTFSPFIDESYDNILDDKQRLIAVASEMERLSKMPQEEFESLVEQCNIIADYNRTKMQELKNNVKLVNEFEWVNDYLTINPIPLP